MLDGCATKMTETITCVDCDKMYSKNTLDPVYCCDGCGCYTCDECHVVDEQSKVYCVCCDQTDVDDYEAPNIYPYKKCSACGDRKSCGSYVEKDWFCGECYEEQDWFCEDCYEEESDGDAVKVSQDLAAD